MQGAAAPSAWDAAEAPVLTGTPGAAAEPEQTAAASGAAEAPVLTGAWDAAEHLAPVAERDAAQQVLRLYCSAEDFFAR